MTCFVSVSNVFGLCQVLFKLCFRLLLTNCRLCCKFSISVGDSVFVSFELSGLADFVSRLQVVSTESFSCCIGRLGCSRLLQVVLEQSKVVSNRS